MAYCDEIDPDSWSPGNLLGSYFCGVSSVVGSVTSPVAETVQSGQEAARDVFVHGQDTFGAGVEDVTEAANPLNLFGALAGVSFGGVLAVVGVGIAAGVAADFVFTGGTGTRGVALWLTGGGSRGRSR